MVMGVMVIGMGVMDGMAVMDGADGAAGGGLVLASALAGVTRTTDTVIIRTIGTHTIRIIDGHITDMGTIHVIGITAIIIAIGIMAVTTATGS
jgi:hypothetical protein